MPCQTGLSIRFSEYFGLNKTECLNGRSYDGISKHWPSRLRIHMEHIWGLFMTSLAPADLRGKSLSNDTLFHFYTDALVLSPSITVYALCSPPSTSTSCCVLPDPLVPP